MRNRFLTLLAALCVLTVSVAPVYALVGQDVQPLWEAGETRSKIVVISDIHLGIDDSFAEIGTNRDPLLQFLKRIQATPDVRELVIAGDFLDDWYLPLDYPAYTDTAAFYRKVIANNQVIMDALNDLMRSGIRLVYVPGNHDMLLDAEILDEAMPGIMQARDARGIGAYYTGDRNEIVIEHGHRYDVFSAPDTLSNAELTGSDDTILPAGYFYARYAASWVTQGHPTVPKALPEITIVPDKTDTDQYGAFIYYSILKDISGRITPKEGLEEKIFDMRIAGFDDAYTYLDFYPAQQEDGTISAPKLFRNIQRTWEGRQAVNQVKVPNGFIEAVAGTLEWRYFFEQAKRQYLENPAENVDVVLFGHTHVPALMDLGGDKYYVNEGTWIAHNMDDDKTRTFAVVTTGEKDTAVLYRLTDDGSLIDLGAGAGRAQD